MKWNHWVGIVLAVFSAAGLVYSIWPVPQKSEKIDFSSPEGISGTLVFTHSDQARVGEKTEFLLKISMDQNSIKEKQLTFVSQLEMDSMSVTPRGEGRVTVDPTKPLLLKWQLSSYKAEPLAGTLWLFLESPKGEKDLLLAKPVELEAKKLLGFSFTTARNIFIIGLIIGAIFLLIHINKKHSV